MENPFAKLVREGEEPSMDDRAVVDTVLEQKDDGVYVRDVYEGNIVSDKETRLGTDPEDDTVDERHMEYRRSKGIEEELELDM